MIADAVLEAAGSPSRAGEFPYVEGREPNLTTQEAENLGVTDLLYRAITYFPCCGDENNLNRIHNIQRIAAETDGALVMPGEVFSLNEHVGQRTEEDGYRPAGAIIGDDVYCCDKPANIGGGVSQFTTTLYNAVFFAGVEDVDHTPHTLYFDRYPEGREATLGWPAPDLQFRNDTDAAILIDTDADDTSVTVRFYGDNGGRIVEAGLSDRRDPTEPHDKYEGDPDVLPGEEREVSAGSPGWTVTVTRTITYPDGTTKEESWDWRYRPFPRKLAVHPCELPPDHEDYVDEECAAEVPDVVGKAEENAVNQITRAGLEVAFGDPVRNCPAGQAGKVAAQSPAGGTWVDPGTAVTISLCKPKS
jgi:hypothetical protein